MGNSFMLNKLTRKQVLDIFKWCDKNLKYHDEDFYQLYDECDDKILNIHRTKINKSSSMYRVYGCSDSFGEKLLYIFDSTDNRILYGSIEKVKKYIAKNDCLVHPYTSKDFYTDIGGMFLYDTKENWVYELFFKVGINLSKEEAEFICEFENGHFSDDAGTTLAKALASDLSGVKKVLSLKNSDGQNCYTLIDLCNYYWKHQRKEYNLIMDDFNECDAYTEEYYYDLAKNNKEIVSRTEYALNVAGVEPILEETFEQLKDRYIQKLTDTILKNNEYIKELESKTKTLEV